MDTQNVAFRAPIVHEFLEDLFGSNWPDVWVCGVPGDPNDRANVSYWRGGAARDDAHALDPADNLYYSVSVVRSGRRVAPDFVKAPIIVVDDVGVKIGGSVKVDADALVRLLGRPRRVVETSPQNFQFVFKLDRPITDPRIFERIMREIAAKGLTDPGTIDVVRAMRLPAGINGKLKYGSPSPRVTEFEAAGDPNAVLPFATLCRALGLDAIEMMCPDTWAAPVSQSFKVGGVADLAKPDLLLQALQDLGRVIGPGRDKGVVDIECPFSDEHTAREDSGTSYFGRGAFKCHHGHCQGRSNWDFKGKVRELYDEKHGPAALSGLAFSCDPIVGELVDALADEAAADAARSAALLSEIRKDHAIVRGFKGVANLRGTATRLLSFEPRDVFTQFWDQRGTLAVKGKHTPAGRAMFSGPGMLPTYEGVGMWMPGVEPAGYLNLFPGFAVSPVSGSWKMIDEYLLLVLSSGDPARYGFLLDWLAYCVQNPLGRALTVLCLVGLPGCGKSTLGKIMREIFGHRLSIAATSEADLFGNFNGRLEHALFIHADEAFFGPDPRIRSTFKALVTEPTLRIEEKHETAREVPNRTKMLVTSNEAAALPLEPRDRRSTVFTVSDAWIGDKSRWDALHYAMDKGGEAEAFLHALLHRDLTKFNPRRPHGTLDKVEMALAGSDPVTQFLRNAIDRGTLPGVDTTAAMSGKGRPDWSAGPVTVLRSELYDEFERWAGARQRRASFIPNVTAFGARLRSLIPDLNRGAQKARIGGNAHNVYVFPALEETERALLAALGAGDEAPQVGTTSEGAGTEKS